MDCRLVCTSSMGEEMFTLREGATTIGRDIDNDIQVLKRTVSRHHARLINHASLCEVEDLKSSNGTFVDGSRVTTSILKNGSEIRLGIEVYRFEAIGSVGSDEAMGASRDYSDKAQIATVRVQPPPTAKRPAAVFNLPPLRMKPATDISPASQTSLIEDVKPIVPIK